MQRRTDLQLHRHPGGKPFHFVCLPGLVPDGPETFARQLKLLRGRGSVALVTYPYDRFDLDEVIAGVREEIEAAHSAGLAPVLVGLSVGGGIAIELLRRGLEAGRPLPLRACILVSPMSCLDDLSSMLSRLMAPIIAESGKEGGRPEIALERGRQLFKSLVTRSTGNADVSRAALRWLGPLGLLTPQGYAAWSERRLADRIQATLDRLPPEGSVQRVMAMTRFRGLAGHRGPLCEAPTLILWGSKERQTLDMDGPGTGRLCRPDLACKIFPHLEVHWVYDRDGEEVPHASLLKHARAFNPPLARWLRRCAKAEGVGVLRRGMQRIAAVMPAAAMAAHGRSLA
jgi:pimeloyl-ACP methyl ester carboxylesterase